MKKTGFIFPKIVLLGSVIIAGNFSAESVSAESVVVTDIYLIASALPYAPLSPSGYITMGYWDVDNAGAVGSDGSTGNYMMGLYANYASPSNTCVGDVITTASNSSKAPPTPPGYDLRGYWDVDDAGGVGSDGSRGNYMMGLYTKSDSSAASCITGVYLIATGSAEPPQGPIGYHARGYWDVDDAGSVGTNASRGNYMMGLFVRY